jgi:hypothetical protein
MLVQHTPVRYFAAATEIEVKKKEEQAVELDQKNKKLGVDMAFSE